MKYEVHVDGGIPAGTMEHLAGLHGEGVKKLTSGQPEVSHDERPDANRA